MTDARMNLLDDLAHQLDMGRIERNRVWNNYWEGRRMVTVPDITEEILPTKPHRFVEGVALNGLCAICGCLYDTVRTGDGPSFRLHPFDEPTNRLFPSFPNLAPKGEPSDSVFHQPTMIRAMTREIMAREGSKIIRDCIARLKNARDKDSTNRNLSTLLAVVVKVQKDLEALVGEEMHAESDTHS